MSVLASVKSNTPATVGGGGVGAALAPGGTGAAGAVNVSLVRIVALLDRAQKALAILRDVGDDLRAESMASGDVAEGLLASFGERMSLEQLTVISGMLIEIADGSQRLVQNGHDAARTALVDNFRVRVAQEALHSLGTDGAYVDSRRLAG